MLNRIKLGRIRIRSLMLASDKRRAVHNFHKLDTPAAVTLMSRGVIEFVNSFQYLLLGL